MSSSPKTPLHTDTQPTALELAQLCRDLAELAQQHIAQHRPPRASVLSTKTTPTDVVTQMDRDVEALLRDRLRVLRPEDGFLGEESVDEAVGGTSGLTWVVDPIDGTVNYLYGLPSYSVSIAVVEGQPDPQHWSIVAGAVIRVPDAHLWWAARGEGAWRDGQRLACSSPASLGECLTGTGFGYDATARLAQAQWLPHVLPKVRDLRRIGSAALDLCALAEGALDLYYERGLSPWDVAAGQLIAEEAGAVSRGLHTEYPTSRMTIVGSQARVDDLQDILRRVVVDDLPMP